MRLLFEIARTPTMTGLPTIETIKKRYCSTDKYMCELFGLSANQAVNVGFTFKGFRVHGGYRNQAPSHRHEINNPNGWGIAFYQDTASVVIKEALRADDSHISEFVSKANDYIKSQIFIAHVRHWNPESMALKNTHPFERELFGRSWTFAHNGSVDKKRLDASSFTPIGNTDSENAFCYLLEMIKIKNPNNLDALISVLKEEIITFNRNFNFLLSDSKYLIAFRKGTNQLYWLKREGEKDYSSVVYKDIDFEKIDIRLTKVSDEKAILIATEEITNESWQKFDNNQLMILENGQIIRNYILKDGNWIDKTSKVECDKKIEFMDMKIKRAPMEVGEYAPIAVLSKQLNDQYNGKVEINGRVLECRSIADFPEYQKRNYSLAMDVTNEKVILLNNKGRTFLEAEVNGKIRVRKSVE
jgi:glutamine amidotransferase